MRWATIGCDEQMAPTVRTLDGRIYIERSMPYAWRVMEEHPIFGGRMLATAATMEQAELAARRILQRRR